MPLLTDILSPNDLQQVGHLQVLARGVVEGFVAGLHRSPHRGNSVEFKQHRPYVPGDDLRSLDWKVYGKTDRFYIREFEEETNLRATLLLDCSGSMAYGAGRETKRRRDEETKWWKRNPAHFVSSSLRLSVSSALLSKQQYAVRLAACLSYLMLRQQDGVGLVTFDTRVQKHIPPRSNPRHLTVLLDAMAGCASGGESGLGRVFHELAPKLHRRGLVILLSDCFGDVPELLRGLAHFRHARHDVIVFQIWHRDELDFPFRGRMRFDDLERSDHRREMDAQLLRKQYLARLAEFRDQLREGCARHRVDLVPVVTDQPYAVALREYLVRRMRGARAAGLLAEESRREQEAGG